jgi:hypothetical protein
MPATHEVLNQPPELPEYDLYATDPILPEAVAREGAGWAEPRLSEFGVLAGTYEVREWGFQANRHGPVLHTHDRFGRRLDQVEFHPSWHSLMELSVRHGVHSLGFEDAGPEGSIVARTALMYLDSQMEQGHGCPISMTSSVLPALRNQPGGGGRLGAAGAEPGLRPAIRPARRQGRRVARDGDDREAGRLRRQGQHHPGGARQRGWAGRCLPAHRSQVVHLGPPVRCLPRPRPGPRRAVVLPPPPLHSTTARSTPSTSSASRTSSATAPTPRARSSTTTGMGGDGRRGGTGRGHDHRDGERHPPRLHDRGGGDHAPGRHPGRPPRRPPVGVRGRRSPTSPSCGRSSPTWRWRPRRPPCS